MSEKLVKAGVAVIIRSQGRVLMGKRKGSHGEGLWAFPGGHIEVTDKSLKACGEREAFEETGILCNVFSPDNYRQDLFTTFDILSEDGTKQYVTCYLISDYISGGDYVTKEYLEIVGKEPTKCETWYWKSIDELVELISEEKDKAWIPINQVVYYLKQLETQGI